MNKSGRAKKIRAGVLACSLMAALTIGGAAAYFTDVQTKTNTFTVGRISVELTEPNWNEENGQDIVPDKEIPKDPILTNDGVNDAYVFAKVRVPVANVVTASESGTKNPAADTQLFSYTVDPNWTLVTANVTNGAAVTLQNRTGNYGVRGDGYVEYIYAYTGTDSSAMQAIAASESTTKLFPAVKFVNAVEDQGLEELTETIVVTGYAIQADFINNGDAAVDGNNAGGQTAPNTVWQIFQTQNA